MHSPTEGGGGIMCSGCQVNAFRLVVVLVYTYMYSFNYLMTGDTSTELPYLKMMNNVLPPEIRVLAWCPVTADFSARYTVTLVLDSCGFSHT